MMNNSNEITLNEAITLTHAYQNDLLFTDQTIAVKTSIETYLDIINQPGCIEVRSYFAKDLNGKLTLVVIGVDVNGNDIINGKIMDRFDHCPMQCNSNSPLMP